jgi:hypothetical protein
MREGPKESIKAAVSRGADVEPVIGLTHPTDRLSTTAPVRPLAVPVMVLMRPIFGSQSLFGKWLGSRGTVAPLVLLA